MFRKVSQNQYKGLQRWLGILIENLQSLKLLCTHVVYRLELSHQIEMDFTFHLGQTTKTRYDKVFEFNGVFRQFTIFD